MSVKLRPDEIVALIEHWRDGRTTPLVVAIDGRGGSGKSTLAARLAQTLGAALLHTDDFFQEPAGQDTPAAAGAGVSWPAEAPAPATATAPTPARPITDYYDLQRLRREALRPLREGRPASFTGHDQSRPAQRPQPQTVAPAPVILLDGVTSAGPDLADLVDRRVLITISDRLRLDRLRKLVAPEDWNAPWLAAEQAYFADPSLRFDAVIDDRPDPTEETR